MSDRKWEGRIDATRLERSNTNFGYWDGYSDGNVRGGAGGGRLGGGVVESTIDFGRVRSETTFLSHFRDELIVRRGEIGGKRVFLASSSLQLDILEVEFRGEQSRGEWVSLYSYRRGLDISEVLLNRGFHVDQSKGCRVRI